MSATVAFSIRLARPFEWGMHSIAFQDQPIVAGYGQVVIN